MGSGGGGGGYHNAEGDGNKDAYDGVSDRPEGDHGDSSTAADDKGDGEDNKVSIRS